MTLTKLRTELFKVADQVLASGEPVLIERNGQQLILATQTAPSKLSRLSARPLIQGDASDLWQTTVSEWQEPNNLKG